MKNSILFGLGVVCGLAVPFIVGSSEAPVQDQVVKRVVASPGDVISVRERAIYVNGKRLDEPATIQFQDYR